MKTIKYLSVLFFILLLGAGPASAVPQKNQGVDINSFPSENLSQDEIDGLLLMREEEKLARDVYAALYDKWNLKIFSNIARSEQQHTDRVKDLLDKYGLKDPMTTMSQGRFSSKDLQKLYNELVQKGSVSLVEALKVGATIEDLDIKDLNDLISQTDNQDIRFVYENLKKGSMNHIRSFNRQLSQYGEKYEAQFISQSELDQILGSDNARGKRNR